MYIVKGIGKAAVFSGLLALSTNSFANGAGDDIVGISFNASPSPVSEAGPKENSASLISPQESKRAFTLKKNSTIMSELDRWAKDEGWVLQFDGSAKFPTPNSIDVSGTFLEAVDQVLTWTNESARRADKTGEPVCITATAYLNLVLKIDQAQTASCTPNEQTGYNFLNIDHTAYIETVEADRGMKLVAAGEASEIPIWTVSPKYSLRTNLFNWAEKERLSTGREYYINWKYHKDVIISAPGNFSGTFRSAVKQLFETLEHNGIHLAVDIGTNNAVLIQAKN